MWNPLESFSRSVAFLHRHRSGAVLACAVLSSAWIYSLGSTGPPGPFRQVVDLGLGTLQTGASTALGFLNVWVWKESRDLREALMRERLDRGRLEEALTENARLRAMLGFPPPAGFRAVPCMVVSLDPEPLGGSLTVDRGTVSGLAGGEAVVSVDGLVGHVAEVFSARARVRLVANYDAPVAVRIQRNRVLGVVEWDPGAARLLMRNVPATEEVAEGDTLISSGLGGVYPEGLYVGSVEAVRPDPMGLVQEIVVRPGARFNRLEELFLLLPGGR
jgi:rod shape-determining protein MreC